MNSKRKHREHCYPTEVDDRSFINRLIGEIFFGSIIFAVIVSLVFLALAL